MDRGYGMSEKLLRDWVKDTFLIEQVLDASGILNTLEKLGYNNIKKLSSRRFAVLIDGPAKARSEALGKIENELKSYGAVWDKQPSSVSSMGMVKLGNISILAKPASRQGGQSAGLGNESILVDAVNNHVNEFGPVDVEFLGPGAGSFLVKGVTAAESAGSDTKGRKKSDVNLVTASGKIPVSVKKDDAVYWESADTFYGSRAATKIDELLESGEIEIIDKGGYYNISPNIAIAASAQETKDVVFGSDILGTGAVIKKTFAPDAFSYDQAKNTLVVQSTYIITDPSHVVGDYTVWFFIRNDKTRKSVPGYPGIRVLAAYEKRINSNVKRFNEGYNLLRRIIRESILTEELTGADKKEINKLIKKGIEKDRAEQKKLIQKELEAELKKSLGTSFFRQPGKIRKTIEDVCRQELAKEMKKGSDLEKSVVAVTKKVLSAWHELLYKQQHIIQRVKI
jgi:hypothetical protein